ncbi:DNAH5 family protein [Megaselia abdita]
MLNFSQLDEINQLFQPNMRNKLLWFYQEVDEPEPVAPPVDVNKPGPSRAGASSSTSKTPQGTSPSGPVTKQKKLFLTDGWTCAFTGVCIYIFRINNSKQLPEEGFQKDL